MRFFRGNQSAQSEEDRARDLRLTLIASRARSRNSVTEASSDRPPAPELQQ
jgi:hypothetical protein